MSATNNGLKRFLERKNGMAGDNTRGVKKAKIAAGWRDVRSLIADRNELR
jgi:hypothetical protein